MLTGSLFSFAFVAPPQVEPYYCMAWVLTWFAHDLHDLPTVARLYDVLLGAHPTLIFYICAAVSAGGCVRGNKPCSQHRLIHFKEPF